MSVLIEDLTVSYGDVVAVSKLSLEIAEGEMVVLLGPSGCGKSSTMRSVAGLEKPKSGRISIEGKTVFDEAAGINIPPNRRKVGMVFQSYAIWPHMTVARNVDYSLRRDGTPRQEWKSRTETALELVGLEGLGDRGASQLSGGQMQRVALARSIVMEPQVLLLDEPLSNLDAKLRERLRFELKKIQRRLGITTIYVTHDQSEALALADRIVVLRSGEIEHLGTPEVVYREPPNRFVADFMGVSNIWDISEVREEEDVTHIRISDASLELRSVSCCPNSGNLAACIRPEAATVSMQKPSHSEATNVIRGRIVNHSYLGTHSRFEVSLDSAVTIDIVQPGELVSGDQTDQDAWVSIPYNAIQVLTT